MHLLKTKQKTKQNFSLLFQIRPNYLEWENQTIFCFCRSLSISSQYILVFPPSLPGHCTAKQLRLSVCISASYQCPLSFHIAHSFHSLMWLLCVSFSFSFTKLFRALPGAHASIMISYFNSGIAWTLRISYFHHTLPKSKPWVSLHCIFLCC